MMRASKETNQDKFWIIIKYINYYFSLLTVLSLKLIKMAGNITTDLTVWQDNDILSTIFNLTRIFLFYPICYNRKCLNYVQKEKKFNLVHVSKFNDVLQCKTNNWVTAHYVAILIIKILLLRLTSLLGNNVALCVKRWCEKLIILCYRGAFVLGNTAIICYY